VELLLQAGANPNTAGGINLPVWSNNAEYMHHGGHLTPLWLAKSNAQMPRLEKR